MKFRTILFILFALLLVVFTIQNTESVGVTLGFWEVYIPSALLIVSCLAVGLLLGLIIARKRSGVSVTNEQEKYKEKDSTDTDNTHTLV